MLTVRVKVQHFAALKVVARVNTACECSVLRSASSHIVCVAAFKRVVCIQISGERRRHIQRNATVEVRVRSERHAVQRRVDIRLGAVDNKAAGAVGPFNERQSSRLGQIQYAVAHRQRDSHSRISSAKRIGDGNFGRRAAGEGQRRIFVDRLSRRNGLNRFHLIVDRDRHRFGVAVARRVGRLNVDIVRSRRFVIQQRTISNGDFTRRLVNRKPPARVIGQAECEI